LPLILFDEHSNVLDLKHGPYTGNWLTHLLNEGKIGEAFWIYPKNRKNYIRGKEDDDKWFTATDSNFENILRKYLTKLQKGVVLSVDQDYFASFKSDKFPAAIPKKGEISKNIKEIFRLFKKYQIPVYLVNGACSAAWSPAKFQGEFIVALQVSAGSYESSAQVPDKAMTVKKLGLRSGLVNSQLTNEFSEYFTIKGEGISSSDAKELANSFLRMRPGSLDKLEEWKVINFDEVEIIKGINKVGFSKLLPSFALKMKAQIESYDAFLSDQKLIVSENDVTKATNLSIEKLMNDGYVEIIPSVKDVVKVNEAKVKQGVTTQKDSVAQALEGLLQKSRHKDYGYWRKILLSRLIPVSEIIKHQSQGIPLNSIFEILKTRFEIIEQMVEAKKFVDSHLGELGDMNNVESYAWRFLVMEGLESAQRRFPEAVAFVNANAYKFKSITRSSDSGRTAAWKYIYNHGLNAAIEYAKTLSRAMTTEKQDLSKGGIDLTPANMNLQTHNAGVEIKFHMDSAMLQQLQNAPGLIPVIINIQPLNDLRMFLGLGESSQQTSS
ncbi:MAG: hypothetical protein WCH62_05535, partial [Candidatus Omnitrophota bacterium]